ncbi:MULTISPECIES: B12-binding domain-containing radical SAM protein [unclassified Streptomyces]|uniref:B12-binding domain-containing radical SAM protein n=1 Tax=unclassified Streptomyces TaxID=2593676 RepID=UPI002E75DC36|nr:radical SAM protein [Streptomyces sp. JV184]MEE1745565.1 radical SAM protein [Streptomyces sp. JV184]
MSSLESSGPADAGTTVLDRQKIVLVELPTYENILPLASGYIQAYVQDDPAVAVAHTFEIVSYPISEDRHQMVRDLAAKDAHLYTFSCYIWNMKLVRWVLDELRALRPDAHYLLGGPQVMNHASTYLADGAENVYVCNGEGERTSLEFIKQIGSDDPDMRKVPGLSFWSGGELITTEAAPRIQNLMDIPSPFLNGVFDDHEFSFAIMETNRGCPFRCTFCYWGAATNSKVNKFEEERIKAELKWISEHRYSALMIADANWGLSPRDVTLSEYIVQCSEENGYPLIIHMAAAKNRPERMAEITEIFVRGGLMVSQPISLQTMNESTLEMVDRKNIREETYIGLQRLLREKRISSYVEMIWPLPGETIESFKEGLTRLCRSYADTIIVYPQLFLHNTPMYGQRESLGILTAEVPSDVSEAEVVLGTKWVTEQDCRDGYWVNHALYTLYNMRALFVLSGYLDSTGIVSYGELFAQVSRYFRTRTDTEVCRFLIQQTDDLANYDLLNTGKTAHMILSSHREEFDRILADFVTAQDWWADPMARQAFEIDLLARAYVYREPVRTPDYAFTETVLRDQPHAQGFMAEVSAELLRLLVGREMLQADAVDAERVTLHIDHRGRQKMPYMPQRSLEHNANYCHGMVLRSREILPNIQVESAGALAPVA